MYSAIATMSGVGQRQSRHGGHAWRLPPLLDHRNDQLAVQIGERELRAEQVGAARLAAAKVGAMARPAVDLIEQLAAIARRLVGELPLLRRESPPRRLRRRRLHPRARGLVRRRRRRCTSRTRRCGGASCAPRSPATLPMISAAAHVMPIVSRMSAALVLQRASQFTLAP